MNSKDIITLGLGLQAPWEITGQLLDTDKKPHELRLTIQAQRGTCYPCPICGALCHAHDFKEMTWRHLNFFGSSTNQVDLSKFCIGAASR